MQEEIELFVTADEGVDLPEYATLGASGADVRAKLVQALVIVPGSVALIPTGIRFEIPEGYEIQVRPRSGLALKHGISILNTPGTIDADYRGELGIILINHGKENFIVEPRMRIAQIVLAPTMRARFIHKKKLQTSMRGEGGFGHSGVN